MSNASPLPMVKVEAMDTVVAVAIGILAAVFVGALAVLVVLCRRHKGSLDVFGWTASGIKPDDHLIPTERPDLELGDVRLHPDIEQILEDEKWIGDATGLVPHCLAVLKSCHYLTERLAALAMGPLTNGKAGQEIVQVARRIYPRVDDMVSSMYPPLDARLLEARTAALTLAVTHLALVTRHACSFTRSSSSRLDWIDQALADMEPHLLALREAALIQEATWRVHRMSCSGTN
uniref:Transmembrane protein 98 n=2 Tax=Timema TaxID=61471 RepID=A0A7R9IDX4_9NEOP|nr:unnamed protein product [Timema bartmani]CAD7456537.1 unnamed protein product [Timema tahoe]